MEIVQNMPQGTEAVTDLKYSITIGARPGETFNMQYASACALIPRDHICHE